MLYKILNSSSDAIQDSVLKLSITVSNIASTAISNIKQSKPISAISSSRFYEKYKLEDRASALAKLFLISIMATAQAAANAPLESFIEAIDLTLTQSTNTPLVESFTNHPNYLPNFHPTDTEFTQYKHPLYPDSPPITVVIGADYDKLQVFSNQLEEINNLASKNHDQIMDGLSMESKKILNSLQIELELEKNADRAFDANNENLNERVFYRINHSHTGDIESKIKAIHSNAALNFLTNTTSQSPITADLISHVGHLNFGESMYVDGALTINVEQASQLENLNSTTQSLVNKHPDIFIEQLFFHELAHRDIISAADGEVGELIPNSSLDKSNAIEHVFADPKKLAQFQYSEIYADVFSVLMLHADPKYSQEDILSIIEALQDMRSDNAKNGDITHYSSTALELVARLIEDGQNLDQENIIQCATQITSNAINDTTTNSILDLNGKRILSPPSHTHST